MTAKQTLLNWLANNDLQKVLHGLFYLADKYKDELLRNDTILQSGRLKDLEEQRMKDTISRDDNSLQTAKVRDSLLSIIQNIHHEWTLDGMEDAPVIVPVSSKANWKKYVAYGTALVALLAGIAEMTGYSVRDVFQKKEPTEIPAEKHPPAPKASTSGDNSPAIITDDGDVNINYGEAQPKKDSTTNK